MFPSLLKKNYNKVSWCVCVCYGEVIYTSNNEDETHSRQ